VIFFGGEALLDRIVRKYYDLGGANLLERAALDLACERVTVSPDFKLGTGTFVLGRPLFDGDHLLVLVTTPPLVQFFLEVDGIALPERLGLAGPGWSDPPLVLELPGDDCRVRRADIF